VPKNKKATVHYGGSRKEEAHMLVTAPKPSRAEYPATLIDRLWWRPSKIAYFNGNDWITLPYAKYTPTAKWKASATLSASPLDINGQCWYLAFDVDCGLEVVRRIIQVLPPGCHPVISRSGGRNGAGYPCWLFLDQPVEVQTAVSFLKLILAKAGVEAEIFPASKNTKPLKLPGSIHPETHVCEEFWNIEANEAYDNALVWQALLDGLYRTPSAIITEYVRQNAKDVQPAKKPKAKTAKATKANRQATAWLASQERLCDYLMQLAGRPPVRIGASFRCILPGHQEKHPSANFVRGEGGVIFYHDWHQRQGQEWYTLGEVFAALVSGQVKKLRPVENARWLALLGLQAGVFTSQAASCRKYLEEVTFTFTKFLKEAFKVESIASNSDPSQATFILPVVCKNHSTTDQSKGRRNQPSTHEVLLRVWRVVSGTVTETVQGTVSATNELAAKVFRRGAGRKRSKEAEAGLVEKRNQSGNQSGLVEKRNQSGNQSGNQNELAAIEAAIKRLSKEVALAEGQGDMARVNDLMRQVTLLGKRRLTLLRGGAASGFNLTPIINGGVGVYGKPAAAGTGGT